MGPLARITCFSAMALMGFSGVTNAQRQIDENGAGNCIFGPQALPFQKEGSAPYRRVTDTFSPGQDIYGRCYYNGTVNEHRKFGKLVNSIRDEGYYYVVVSWHEPLPDGKILSHGRLRPIAQRMRLKASETGDWDQQSLYFTKNDCDLKVEAKDMAATGAYRNRCVNFADMARYMEKQKGLDPQPRSKFCAEVVLVYADKKRKRWVSDSWVYEDIKDYRKMAGGCFFIDHQ